MPFVIETASGGLQIRSIVDLRRLARTHARLSPGFIQASTFQELLDVVCRAVNGTPNKP